MLARVFKRARPSLKSLRHEGHARGQASATPRPSQTTTPSKRDPKPEEKYNPHTVFYRKYSLAYFKVLGITMGTYYSLQYLWDFLESQQSEASKNKTQA